MSAETPANPTAKDDSKPAAGRTTLPLRPKPETAADPDEDDLDDLDDVLDEFSASKAQPAPAAATAGQAPAKDAGNLSSEDFDDELAKEMAKLISDVDSNPEMKKQIEAMMKELGSVVEQQVQQEDEPASAAGSSKGPAGSAAAEDSSFQETIRKTMERMQASGDKATAEASADGGDDFMAEMLKQMQGGGSDEDFNKMLMGMMEQLTNKEILYEPMKDLHDKFPGWMETHKDKTPAADLARFKEQQKLVGEIVARFESPSYSDDNGQDREYIVERMQQMQAQGSPPSDLIGDMEDAQKAIGDLDAGCPQQ